MLLYQEYPPGITLVPMKSRTREPFHTTNLIVVVADDAINEQKDSSFVTYGNSLLVDPGCSSRFHPDVRKSLFFFLMKFVYSYFY